MHHASLVTWQPKSGYARLHEATIAIGAAFALLLRLFGQPVAGKG